MRKPVYLLPAALLLWAVAFGPGELQAGPAVPKCFGKRATIVGTNGNDTIKGTRRADVVVGLGGNDKISGLGKADLVCGGAGKDSISGGKGPDKLSGDQGTDSLSGGAGVDLCKLGESLSSCERLALPTLTLSPGSRYSPPAGVRQLIVSGDVTVAQGASLQGSGNLFSVVVGGDLNLEGEISSTGHLAVVSKTSLVPTLSELTTPTDENGIGTGSVGGSGNANWMITGDLVAGAPSGPRTKSTRSSTAVTQGQNGRAGWVLTLYVLGNATIGSSTGNLTQNVPNGGDAPDITGCNVTGGIGGRGGSLSVAVSSQLTVHNITFDGGNGGDGGSATGTGCNDGDTNTGGKGGRPGEIHLTAGAQVTVDGTMSFTGWNGGMGGDADISGKDGNPGASVTAVGGKGGDVNGRLSVNNVNFTGGGNLQIAGFSGGDGGMASAKGGNGIAGTPCDPHGGGTPGGNGGNATATGGNGGDANVTFATQAGPVGILGGTAVGGNGGNASASPGNGGNPGCPPGTKGTDTAAGGKGGVGTLGNGGDGSP